MTDTCSAGSGRRKRTTTTYSAADAAAQVTAGTARWCYDCIADHDDEHPAVPQMELHSYAQLSRLYDYDTWAANTDADPHTHRDEGLLLLSHMLLRRTVPVDGSADELAVDAAIETAAEHLTRVVAELTDSDTHRRRIADLATLGRQRWDSGTYPDAYQPLAQAAHAAGVTVDEHTTVWMLNTHPYSPDLGWPLLYATEYTFGRGQSLTRVPLWVALTQTYAGYAHTLLGIDAGHRLDVVAAALDVAAGTDVDILDLATALTTAAS